MKKTNSFKLAVIAVGMLTIGTVSAQETDASAVTLTKQGKEVKIVDNKGTIKYIQTANGLTQITSTTAGNKTVTTFQLGGELISATTITADAINGKTFAVAGIQKIDVTTAGLLLDENNFATNADFDTKGFTFVVRDEATGEIKKISAADISKYVVAIQQATTLVADIAAGTTGQSIVVANLPVITAFNSGKLFIYRNGVKLRFGTDFTAAVAGTVELINPDYDLYIDDIIEIQFTR